MPPYACRAFVRGHSPTRCCTGGRVTANDQRNAIAAAAAGPRAPCLARLAAAALLRLVVCRTRRAAAGLVGPVVRRRRAVVPAAAHRRALGTAPYRRVRGARAMAARQRAGDRTGGALRGGARGRPRGSAPGFAAACGGGPAPAP